MREAWGREVTERAAAYWTPERTRKLTSGKPLPLLPAEAGPLLRALGLLNGDGSMSADAVRKYLQINHLVTLLEPAFKELAGRFNPVRVLDAGCGSSYLTFLLAWCFRHRWHHPAQILGVDRNAKVIEKCRERAEMAELGAELRFLAAPLEGLDVPAAWREAFERSPSDTAPAAPPAAPATPVRPNALVALHACDTATDEALALAITLKADFVAVAPCCQAELARRWSELAGGHTAGALGPVWRSPHLRRELGASMTDAMRTVLLRGCGYEVTAMEFVPSTHTPKNTLLRAHRRGAYLKEALAEYVALVGVTGGQDIRLAELLPAEHAARLGAARGAAPAATPAATPGSEPVLP